jgi:hypothetical protein
MKNHSSNPLLAISILTLTNLTSSAHQSDPQQPFERPHAHDAAEFHIHTGWESRYFSEGRDALDGDSIWASSFEFGLEHLAAGFWYGKSPDQSYDELQLSLALTQTFGDFETYIGYTHYIFPFDGSHDNEIGTGITWTGLPAEIEISADIYHSFDADGYFAELSASREFEISQSFNIIPSSIFGINQGYVSDGHDGANHFALQIACSYNLTESVSLVAHTTYSWTINKSSTAPGDALLKDFIHFGAGIQWDF